MKVGPILSAALAVLIVAATGCATSAPSSSTEAAIDALHVERLGAGDTTVVFLPGIMGSTRYWHGGELEGIAETNRVLLLDELGFGRSPRPAVQYTHADIDARAHFAVDQPAAV